MGGRISFRMNYEKAVEALVLLAKLKPGIDIYHISKVLFYADKRHLNLYARPVLGDDYICMQHGPVPSGVRDLLTENAWLSPDLIDKVAEALEIEGRHRNLRAKREPDLSLFSETDIECLEWSLREYGDKPFSKLRDLTHKETCYLVAGTNEPIDYRYMVDETNPNRAEILSEMEESAAYASL